MAKTYKIAALKGDDRTRSYGKVKTADLGGSATTSEMADAVASKLSTG